MTKHELIATLIALGFTPKPDGTYEKEYPSNEFRAVQVEPFRWSDASYAWFRTWHEERNTWYGNPAPYTNEAVLLILHKHFEQPQEVHP